MDQMSAKMSSNRGLSYFFSAYYVYI